MSQGVIKFEEKFRNDEYLREMIEVIKTDLLKMGKRKYHVTIA